MRASPVKGEWRQFTTGDEKPATMITAMAQLIITAVGPDRPGIVGELTSHLHAAGANLLDTRMVNLRGEFAMMILLEAPDTAAIEKLRRDLPAAGESMRLRISATP